MRRIIKLFLRDESGGTAIEYGLIAAFISLTIFGTVPAIGTGLQAKFNILSDALS